MAKHKTHHEDCDILVVGGGMAGTGATFEARHWGRDMKIVCVEKANIDRSGAVAQGLYAINCYMGMQWGENQPEDHVRYARNDLMGMVREDLGYDMARHVDSTVHMFDEWGLPMMKNEETGRYLREGKWQIMIHGESYKPIVAEAAKKSAAIIQTMRPRSQRHNAEARAVNRNFEPSPRQIVCRRLNMDRPLWTPRHRHTVNICHARLHWAHLTGQPRQ
jgi:succinate dehydrogenase/fumarate reductase flavoprotein subunit